MDEISSWGDISQSLQKIFAEKAQTLEFKRGDFVYHQNESPKGLYFIKNGLVGLTILGANSGKEYLLRFFKEGQFFGHRSLLSGEPYHGNALVLEASTFTFVPMKTVEDVLQKKPELYKYIAIVLAKELRRAETQHVSILENQIIPRVAQSLIYLKDIDPEHNWTRQEIANFCGSTVSTVIKALASIEDLGYIKQSGRSIEILNRKELLALQDI